MIRYKISFLFPVLIFLIACSENEPDDIDQLFFGKLNNSGKLDYTVYSTIPATKKQVVFYDGFTDNAGKWLVGKNSQIGNLYDFHVTDGYYFMDYDNWGGDEAAIPKDVGSEVFTGNFEIETSLEFLDSHSSTSDDFGIIWNYYNNDNRPIGYYFKACYSTKIITIGSDNESQYTIWKTIEASKSPLTNSKLVKLTIRSVDNYYYFFINELFVAKYKFQPINYSKAGFLIGDCGIRADYFQVSTIIK
jgi:hypothetical protein